MTGACANVSLPRAKSRSCLSSSDLSGKRKSVGEEKLSKASQLEDFFRAQFIVVMCSLIAIKPDQVGPLLQIIGQLSRLMKGINPWSEVLSCEAAIKLPGRHVESLPIHGCCSIGVASGSVIRALHICPLNGRRDVFWNFYALWRRVDPCYHCSPCLAFCTKLAVALSDPAVVERSMFRCHTHQVIAGIAAKYDGGIFSARRRCHHVTHSHRLRPAVRAGINEGVCHE